MKHFYAFLVVISIFNFGFAQTSSDGWVNEIHYDNGGADIEEAAEIVIADVATYPLANWYIQPYDGNGGIQVDGNNFFSAIEGDQQSVVNGFTIASISVTLQNGAPDGLALVYDDGVSPLVVVQFLSWEGTFTATDGEANGLNSIDIGVNEGFSTQVGESLQLSGNGTQYSDFTWQGPTTQTRGAINNGQTFNANDATTEVSSGTQPAAGSISSTVDTAGEAIDVFDLLITDQGGDGLSTIVTNIRLKSGLLNTVDFTDNIQGFTINNGAITVNSLTITDNFVDIGIANGDLVIADNTSSNVTIGVFLNSSNISDNENLQFSVDADDNGFSATGSGTGFAPVFSAGDFNSNSFLIEVNATTIQQATSGSDTTVGEVMNPGFDFIATDQNGNLDIDYSGDVTIFATNDALLFDPSATTTVTASGGVASFDNLIFSNTGTDSFVAQGVGLGFSEETNNITVTASLAPVVIAKQDFEFDPQTPVYGFSFSSGSNITASTVLEPAGSNNFVSGERGWKANNETSILLFETIDVSDYNDIQLSLRLASLATSNIEGTNLDDFVSIEISLDGGATFSNEISVIGNSNSRWSFAEGNAVAESSFDGDDNDTSFSPAGGGERTFDGYSTIIVSGIPNTSELRVRITLENNDTSEYWIIDDVELSAVAGSVVPELIISEIMYNLDLSDGRYFEVYNPTKNAIDMNGWTLSDDGTNSHVINTTVIVPALGFAVLARNDDPFANGGFLADYMYVNFNLSDDDQIILTDRNNNLIDRVDYDDLDWPNSRNEAMIFTGSDMQDNNTPALWRNAPLRELGYGVSSGIQLGSPGENGKFQIVAYLVFDTEWTRESPSADTGRRTAYILRNRSTSLDGEINLKDLIVSRGADLTINSGSTVILDNLYLLSNSTRYSNLINNGAITGEVTYSRFVNEVTFVPSEGNDLVSPPLAGQRWSNFLNSDKDFLKTGTNITKILNNGATPNVYAFAPFDKSVTPEADFVNFDENTVTTLDSGTGFRAATISGSALNFTGNIPTSPVDVPITVSGNSFEVWNLIGNPFPSHISLSEFLTINNDQLSTTSSGVYGYNAFGYDVYNQAFSDANVSFAITPGQGFFVASQDGGGTVSFTDAMRSTNNLDDFIEGRFSNSTPISHLKLKMSTDSKFYNTDFYFTANASLDLDPNYDSSVYGGSGAAFSIYSSLVEDSGNLDLSLAVQSFGDNAFNDLIVMLGVNANQGEQLTIGISESDIPETIEVYLEDTVLNTFTLLNIADYVFTPSSNLSGTGRFFLRFSTETLSTPEENFETIQIYTTKTPKTLFVKGTLQTDTTLEIYDIQGRMILNSKLDTRMNSNEIDISGFTTGVYIVKLNNTFSQKSQKVIIN